MTEPGNEPRRSEESGRNWAIAGIVCGILAFFIAPILLGPLSVVFGVAGYRRGSRRSGAAAIIIGGAAFVVGVIVLIAALSTGGQNLS